MRVSNLSANKPVFNNVAPTYNKILKGRDKMIIFIIQKYQFKYKLGIIFSHLAESEIVMSSISNPLRHQKLLFSLYSLYTIL